MLESLMNMIRYLDSKFKQIGGAMKRLILTIFIFTIIQSSSSAQNISVQYSNYGYEENQNNSQLRALQKFEDNLDQFSYSLMVGDEFLARKTKMAIIRAMEYEIWQTEKEIEKRSWRTTYYSKRNTQEQFRSRRGGIYSKNTGYNQDLGFLYRQLDEQKRIKHEFEITRLKGSRRNVLINKRYHRTLMYKYRDLMRDKLETTRRDNRERRG